MHESYHSKDTSFIILVTALQLPVTLSGQHPATDESATNNMVSDIDPQPLVAQAIG